MKNRKTFFEILFLLSIAFLALSFNQAFSENTPKYLDGIEGKRLQNTETILLVDAGL